MLTREREKLERVLGGISELNRIPTAIFMVDITHEHIALSEATRLGLRTFAMVDTNSDPSTVDFPIPANDDASKAIEIVVKYLGEWVKAGYEEREQQKAEQAAEAQKREQEEAQAAEQAARAQAAQAEAAAAAAEVPAPEAAATAEEAKPAAE